VTSIGNMVKRVLFIIREEYASEADMKAPVLANARAANRTKSLQTLMVPADDLDDYLNPKLNLKTTVIEGLNELREELENSRYNIATHAQELIHSKEIILTFGHSFTVESFFKAAKRKRDFQVIVVEAAPTYKGHSFAVQLAQEGIEATVITDSAVFAIMSRVNKVIIGAHAVMADGGLLTQSGAHNVALAAKHHAVPVIVCAAIYKLTPQFPCAYDQDEYNDLVAPELTLPYSEAGIYEGHEVRTPLYDYVPPDLISLFITNIGGNAPSYVYRLLSEFYHPDDHHL